MYMNIIDSSLVANLFFFARIVSVILGVGLVVAGIHYKNKNMKWWPILALLGIASIITNIIQFLL
ncbi:MAG: hypothetical protein ACK5LC_02220 [Coprobacillaceae bacterium]